VEARRYVLGKAFQAVLTLAFILVFNFFLFRVMPGDPATLLLRGTGALSAEAIEAVNRDLGLDQPFPAQFVNYVGDTLTLDFGRSLASGDPVSDVVGDRIWPTIVLVGTSTIASAALGLVIGIYAAWRRGSAFDLGSTGATLVAYSMPEFWFGILVLMAFAAGVGPFPAIFPTGGFETAGAGLTGIDRLVDILNHLALPFITLTVAYLGEYALIMRSSVMDVMGEDFVQTARAKGLREKQVLWRHTVPNALLPTITLTFLSLGFIFSGTITIEYVFSYPGLGLLTVEAIDNKDFPVLQAVFLLFSVSVIVANLLADLLYAYLDPRVKAA
jgi:peptide/nickel transport system permease protein